uniref:Putative secreted protein n=1 Tax=Ixodes ricinus TaxID=34613 RepID=A0A6B0UI33_IXORI
MSGGFCIGVLSGLTFSTGTCSVSDLLMRSSSSLLLLAIFLISLRDILFFSLDASSSSSPDDTLMRSSYEERSLVWTELTVTSDQAPSDSWPSKVILF